MRKIINKKGFSISELLVVVMVLGLIMCIIGGGVVVVKNAYERITLRAEAQSLMSTTVTELTDEFRFARQIDSEKNPVTFRSSDYGCIICFDNGGEKGIIIKNTVNDDTATLLSDKTMTDGLVSKLKDGYTYKDGIFKTTVVIVNSKGETVLQQEIKVRAINQ